MPLCPSSPAQIGPRELTFSGENEGYPCGVREVAVARVHGGKPRVSDEWRHVWSFVLLMEFYPLPFQSRQTIKRATAKRDRLTQQ